MTRDLAHEKEQGMGNITKQRGKLRIRWTDEDGKRRSAVFLKRKDAERELRLRQAEVAEIQAGLRDRRPPDKSFSELCDYWLKHRAPAKKSTKDDESIIRRHLRPFFGELRLAEIRVADADAFKSARAELNPKTVANLVTLFVSMLNCAQDLGWLRVVPRIRKPKVRFADKDYRYLKSGEEVRRLLLAAQGEGEMILALYATAVFTGMRAGELAGLEWKHVDFKGRLITVECSYDGSTKGGRVRYVPILDALLPILRSWRLRNPLSIVFPNDASKPLGPSAYAFQETLHRVLERAGFPSTVKGKCRVRAITFHGLRHTFASLWVMQGGDIFKLQRILGHQSIQMTMRYSHLAPDAFAGDLDRFGGRIELNRGEVARLPRQHDSQKVSTAPEVLGGADGKVLMSR